MREHWTRKYLFGENALQFRGSMNNLNNWRFRIHRKAGSIFIIQVGLIFDPSRKGGLAGSEYQSLSTTHFAEEGFIGVFTYEPDAQKELKRLREHVLNRW